MGDLVRHVVVVAVGDHLLPGLFGERPDLLECRESEAFQRHVHAGEKDSGVELFRRDIVALGAENDVGVLAHRRAEVLEELHIQQSVAGLVKGLARNAERHVPRDLVLRINHEPAEEVDAPELRAQDRHD